jgi:hypothetical protein
MLQNLKSLECRPDATSGQFHLRSEVMGHSQKAVALKRWLCVWGLHKAQVNFVFTLGYHLQDISLCIRKYSKIWKYLKFKTILVPSIWIRESQSASEMPIAMRANT